MVTGAHAIGAARSRSVNPPVPSGTLHKSTDSFSETVANQVFRAFPFVSGGPAVGALNSLRGVQQRRGMVPSILLGCHETAASGDNNKGGRMPSRSYRVNEPSIATEKLDSEVMIVNLEKGNYYSLTGTGAAIWDLIASGHNVQAIFNEIVATYAGDSGSIRNSVDRFVSELCAEELIVASDPASEPRSQAPTLAAANRPEFAAPQLEKYTDMQELLLIDPIHEVNDDHGWPKMRS